MPLPLCQSYSVATSPFCPSSAEVQATSYSRLLHYSVPHLHHCLFLVSIPSTHLHFTPSFHVNHSAFTILLDFLWTPLLFLWFPHRITTLMKMHPLKLFSLTYLYVQLQPSVALKHIYSFVSEPPWTNSCSSLPSFIHLHHSSSLHHSLITGHQVPIPRPRGTTNKR